MIQLIQSDGKNSYITIENGNFATILSNAKIEVKNFFIPKLFLSFIIFKIVHFFKVLHKELHFRTTK